MLATETVEYSTDNGPDAGAAPEDWSDGLPLVSTKLPRSPIFCATERVDQRRVVLGPVTHWVGLEQSVIFSGHPFCLGTGEAVVSTRHAYKL